MSILLSIFGFGLAIYFAYSAGFVAFFSLAGLLPIRSATGLNDSETPRRFLVLIPA